MRSRQAYMWTPEEDAKLLEGAKAAAPASAKYKFWEAVRRAVMPYRTLSSVQQRAIKLKLKAKLFGRRTKCEACGRRGVSNKMRCLCRKCYSKHLKRGTIHLFGGG